jgi:hypothetical protein
VATTRDAEFGSFVADHRGRMLRTAHLLTAGDAHSDWSTETPHVPDAAVK